MGDRGIRTGQKIGRIHDLTKQIIECIITVHRQLGPGFLENVYRRALLIELRGNGLSVEPEKEITVLYRGEAVGRHRLDIVVNGEVVLELKTVEALGKWHYAQVRSYLRASGMPVGLLVNFSAHKADFRRIDLNQ